MMLISWIFYLVFDTFSIWIGKFIYGHLFNIRKMKTIYGPIEILKYMLNETIDGFQLRWIMAIPAQCIYSRKMKNNEKSDSAFDMEEKPLTISVV